jgi:hypothetical protein
VDAKNISMIRLALIIGDGLIDKCPDILFDCPDDDGYWIQITVNTHEYAAFEGFFKIH